MKKVKKIVKGVLSLVVVCMNYSCFTYDSIHGETSLNLSNQVVNSSYSPPSGSVVPDNLENMQSVSLKSQMGLESSSLTASGLFGGGDAQDAIFGFHVGLGAEGAFNSKWRGRTGIRYSTKGSKVDLSEQTTNKTRLTYLDIPLSTQYIIKPNFYVSAGLQPSFLLNANLESNFRGEEIRDIDISDNYNGFDMAVTLGLGYEVFEHTKIELLYNHGFLNIQKDADFGEIRNRVFSLGLVYQFKSW
ncbi:MAG: porin family protein [Bacteroidota bacterium]